MRVQADQVRPFSSGSSAAPDWQNSAQASRISHQLVEQPIAEPGYVAERFPAVSPAHGQVDLLGLLVLAAGAKPLFHGDIVTAREGRAGLHQIEGSAADRQGQSSNSSPWRLADSGLADSTARRMLQRLSSQPSGPGGSRCQSKTGVLDCPNRRPRIAEGAC